MTKYRYAVGYMVPRENQWYVNGEDIVCQYQIQMLNEMGARGWQLIAVTPDTTGTGPGSAHSNFYFVKATEDD